MTKVGCNNNCNYLLLIVILFFFFLNSFNALMDAKYLCARSPFKYESTDLEGPF